MAYEKMSLSLFRLASDGQAPQASMYKILHTTYKQTYLGVFVHSFGPTNCVAEKREMLFGHWVQVGQR